MGRKHICLHEEGADESSQNDQQQLTIKAVLLFALVRAGCVIVTDAFLLFEVPHLTLLIACTLIETYKRALSRCPDASLVFEVPSPDP